jgi:hypothetical protein
MSLRPLPWTMREPDVDAVKASPVFTVTTPSVSVTLADNRVGEVPFTVTNVSDRKLRARAKVTPAAGAPADWFAVEGDSEQDFEVGAARQFVVRVDPPLGVSAGTYAFRLDAVGIEHPDDDYSEGPSCQVTIPQSAPPRLTTPRGYLTTLVGAIVGGAVGELTIILAILYVVHATHTDDPNCRDLGCAIGHALGDFIALLFLVGIVVFVGYFVMLVGAAVGSGIALRIRRFRGSKLTALFLGLLFLPWTVLMFVTVFQLLKHHAIVIALISPIVLVAVPAVVARGAVLLIRTHHI